MTRRRGLRGVLFDLDGTLLDTARDMAKALNRVRAVEGLECLPFDRIRPLVSHGAPIEEHPALALVPEWRFYAQASLSGAADFARDTHVVVRDRLADGSIGGLRHMRVHTSSRSSFT